MVALNLAKSLISLVLSLVVALNLALREKVLGSLARRLLPHDGIKRPESTKVVGEQFDL